MNGTTRKTHACSMESLEAGLKTAIRMHASKYGLNDLESDILMCCETLSVEQKKGLFGAAHTAVSAVYITPKWLVWAAMDGRDSAAAGTARLKHIEVRDFQSTAQNAATPDQGLNITGRYTERNRTGITFIALDAGEDGRKFRQMLLQAMTQAREEPFSYQGRAVAPPK